MLDTLIRNDAVTEGDFPRVTADHCRNWSRHKPVLVVLHQEHSDPGHVGQWLRASGFMLDIRRPPLGDTLPQTLVQHSGVVIFGGPMSVNDDLDFLNRERRLIEISLREGSALLGICLGAQLLAQVLGTQVRPDGAGRMEVGYYPIEPTQLGASICEWPDKMYQWHGDGFDLPRGADLLAKAGGAFPDQAFIYGGSAVGIQFHPEITMSMIYRWTTRATHRLIAPGARPREEHISDHLYYQPLVAKWRDGFLGSWCHEGITT